MNLNFLRSANKFAHKRKFHDRRFFIPLSSQCSILMRYIKTQGRAVGQEGGEQIFAI